MVCEPRRGAKGLAPANRIFIGHYPDILRDDKGDLCGDRAVLRLTKNEVEWLNSSFYVRLNKAVTNAAHDHHWHLVVGQAEAFKHHGYCATLDRWVVQIGESWTDQGNFNGILHPRVKGHDKIAELFLRQVRPILKASPKG
jgi:hypothetical protein